MLLDFLLQSCGVVTNLSLSLQNTEDHLTFLVAVPTALFLFLSIFILVCIESVFKRMLRLFSLLIWACLVTMGYLFMFSGGILSPWDQVDILHVGVFTVLYLGKYDPPPFGTAR